MQRVVTVLVALGAATVVAGCGGHENRDRVQFSTGAGQLGVFTRGDALPEGHPPVPGYSPGLPQGHPVCPAGRQQLERGMEDSRASDAAGPELIST
jgi:hypothetical protein